MTRNPVEAILGLVVLIFTGVFLFFASSHVDVGHVEGYPLQALFTKTGGLEIGADIRINGIKVGSVTKIKLDPETYMAAVELTIKDDIRLPKDTQAIIADSGIMGNKYIRLEPGKSKDMLTAGDRFAQTKDYRSLEDNVSEFIFLSTKDDVQK